MFIGHYFPKVLDFTKINNKIVRMVQLNRNKKYLNSQSKSYFLFREKYIEDLQERNKKLKNQIVKITQILETNQNKNKNKKIDIKKFKSKIAESLNAQNPEILKKQLENVYKQIKNYQRQIQKTQNTNGGSLHYSDQAAKLQIIKLQKLQHLDKLRTQLSVLNNTEVSNSKKLKNNIGRQQYENLIVKLGDQLKLLRDKLRNLDQKEKKKVKNAKKQLEYIRKLQIQLVQFGVAMDQIQEMKKKNVFVQVKNIMSKQKNPEIYQESKQKIIQQIQEDVITFEKLQQMKNQIKLYRKLHQDYEKRLSNIQKEKQNCDKLVIDKKKSIEDKNTQIEKLNQQINQIRQIVIKNNNLSNGTLSMASQEESIRKMQKRKSIEVNLQNSMDKNRNNAAAKNSKK